MLCPCDFLHIERQQDCNKVLQACIYFCKEWIEVSHRFQREYISSVDDIQIHWLNTESYSPLIKRNARGLPNGLQRWRSFQEPRAYTESHVALMQLLQKQIIAEPRASPMHALAHQSANHFVLMSADNLSEDLSTGLSFRKLKLLLPSMPKLCSWLYRMRSSSWVNAAV